MIDKNQQQTAVLQLLPKHLQDGGNNLIHELERSENEAIYAVKEYFSKLRAELEPYIEKVIDRMLVTPGFTSLKDKITSDKKLLDDLQRDVEQFGEYFILKDTVEKHLKSIETTGNMFETYTESRFLPKITLHRPNDVSQKLFNILKENVYFENSMSTTLVGSVNPKHSIQGSPELSQSHFIPPILPTAAQGGSVPSLPVVTKLSGVFKALGLSDPQTSPTAGMPLYFLTELGSTLSVYSVNRQSWHHTHLNIPSPLPLGFCTIQPLPGCILVCGGVKAGHKQSCTDVMVLVDGMYAKQSTDQSQKPAPPRDALTLLKIGEMTTPRNNHSIVKVGNKLLVVGGCGGDTGAKLNSCEFTFIPSDIDTQSSLLRIGLSWRKAANCSSACSNPTLVAFRDRFVVKFGGSFDKTRDEGYLELYDSVIDAWYPISARFDVERPLTFTGSTDFARSFMCDTIGSAGFQASHNQILVFGGITSSNQKS